jgi:hypothetical protein
VLGQLGPPGGGAVGPVEGRPLVGVLAVAEGERLAPVGQVLRFRQLLLRLGEPPGDVGVVGRDHGEGPGRQGPAGGGCEHPVAADLLQDRAVVLGPDDHTDVRMVLRRRPDQRRPADVDQLDARVVPEGVEVHDHQVEGLDAVIVQLGSMLRVVPVGQQPPVDLRMQRHHPVTQDRGEPGQLGHVGHREPGVAQRRRRGPRGHQVPAPVGQALGEPDDTGLVVDREQGSGHYSSSVGGCSAGWADSACSASSAS